MLGSTDDAGGKGGLELELRSKGFRLAFFGAAAGGRGRVIVFVIEICGIPDPRSVLLFDGLV